MKRILFLFFILGPLLANTSFASRLHRCFLLPITDTLEGTVGNALFKRIEIELKSSMWCDYQENPGLQRILGKYKRKLGLALQNSNVIKLVGQKSTAGSIIRVKLKYSQNSITLNTDVIDDLGREYLFRHEITMKSDKIADMAAVVMEQLREYGSTLPYQFLITDMMDHDLIAKVISTNSFVKGDIVSVDRPVSPIRHPLLHKVVEWNTQRIGEAEVVQVRSPYIRFKLNKTPTVRPKVGDWGGLLRPGDKIKSKKIKKYSKRYANLYELEGSGVVTKPYAHSNLNGNSEDVQDTFMIGARGLGHLIITKNIWAELAVGHKTGIDSSTHSHIGFNTGIKFYPIHKNDNSFISPYIAYGADNLSFKSEQFAPTTFTGLKIGIYGSHQIIEKYDLTFRLSTGISGSAEADDENYGESSSSSVGGLEIGLRYDYSKEYDIYGGINYSKFSAKFDSDELNYASLNLIGGAVYIY